MKRMNELQVPVHVYFFFQLLYLRNRNESTFLKSEIEKLHLQSGTNTATTYHELSEQLFSSRWPLSYPQGLVLTKYMKTYIHGANS